MNIEGEEKESDIIEKNGNTFKSEICILLIQFNKDASSKTYQYYSKREQVVEYLLKLYEEYLKNLYKIQNSSNTNKVEIVNIEDLLCFFYSLYDFAYFEQREGKDKIEFDSYGKDRFSEIIKEYIKSYR